MFLAQIFDFNHRIRAAGGLDADFREAKDAGNKRLDDVDGLDAIEPCRAHLGRKHALFARDFFVVKPEAHGPPPEIRQPHDEYRDAQQNRGTNEQVGQVFAICPTGDRVDNRRIDVNENDDGQTNQHRPEFQDRGEEMDSVPLLLVGLCLGRWLCGCWFCGSWARTGWVRTGGVLIVWLRVFC